MLMGGLKFKLCHKSMNLMTKRITISLDDKLARTLQETAKGSDLKVSTLVKKAVEEYLRRLELDSEEPAVHPKVVWRVRGRVNPRGPSVRMGRVKTGSFRIVDVDKLQIP